MHLILKKILKTLAPYPLFGYIQVTKLKHKKKEHVSSFPLGTYQTGLKQLAVNDKKLTGQGVHQDKSSLHRVSPIQEPFRKQQRQQESLKPLFEHTRILVLICVRAQ